MNDSKENQFRDILLRSPSPVAILEMPSMIITYANEPILNSWNRKADIIGKSLLEVLPEIKNQHFPELLRMVYETGNIYYGNEEKAVLEHEGIAFDKYYNYVYQPVHSNGKITAIAITANDLTREFSSRKQIESGEKRFTNVIMQSPMFIAIFKGPDMIVEVVNQPLIEIWDKGNDLIGKKWLDIMPELIGQEYPELMNKVYQTGEPFQGFEMSAFVKRNSELKEIFVNFIYQPYIEIDGSISGVTVIGNEVTELVKTRKQIEEKDLQFKNILLHAPGIFLALEGIEMIVTFANNSFRDMLGTNNEIIGKPLSEAFSEIRDQGFPEKLEEVLKPEIHIMALKRKRFYWLTAYFRHFILIMFFNRFTIQIKKSQGLQLWQLILLIR